jgi:hypothetical protein
MLVMESVHGLKDYLPEHSTGNNAGPDGYLYVNQRRYSAAGEDVASVNCFGNVRPNYDMKTMSL